MTKTCGEDTLRSLCGMWVDSPDSGFEEALPWHRVSRDGVYVRAPTQLVGPVERAVMTWHPHGDRERPALPIPFNERELAAFMLAGGGIFLRERFDGDDVALAELDRTAQGAAAVMREALRLCVLADGQFGRSDEAVMAAAKWLLSEEAQRSAGATAEAPVDLDEQFGMGLLATPEQLVGAFGSLTGLSKKWFDSVRDTPGLLAARVRPGRGQRGAWFPPLYDPMKVMLWLLDKKRKKGRQFHNDDTAWRMLEHHFPNVYAKNSAARGD